MFHYAHQPVANFVCLLFGAGRVVYSGFNRAFSLKTANWLEMTLMRAVGLNQNSKVVGYKATRMS